MTPSVPGDGQASSLSKTAADKERKTKAKAGIAIQHIDIIRDHFWEVRPWILLGTTGRLKG